MKQNLTEILNRQKILMYGKKNTKPLLNEQFQFLISKGRQFLDALLNPSNYTEERKREFNDLIKKFREKGEIPENITNVNLLSRDVNNYRAGSGTSFFKQKNKNPDFLFEKMYKTIFTDPKYSNLADVVVEEYVEMVRRVDAQAADFFERLLDYAKQKDYNTFFKLIDVYKGNNPTKRVYFDKEILDYISVKYFPNALRPQKLPPPQLTGNLIDDVYIKLRTDFENFTRTDKLFNSTKDAVYNFFIGLKEGITSLFSMKSRSENELRLHLNQFSQISREFSIDITNEIYSNVPRYIKELEQIMKNIKKFDQEKIAQFWADTKNKLPENIIDILKGKNDSVNIETLSKYIGYFELKQESNFLSNRNFVTRLNGMIRFLTNMEFRDNVNFKRKSYFFNFMERLFSYAAKGNFRTFSEEVSNAKIKGSFPKYMGTFVSEMLIAYFVMGPILQMFFKTLGDLAERQGVLDNKYLDFLKPSVNAELFSDPNQPERGVEFMDIGRVYMKNLINEYKDILGVGKKNQSYEDVQNRIFRTLTPGGSLLYKYLTRNVVTSGEIPPSKEDLENMIQEVSKNTNEIREVLIQEGYGAYVNDSQNMSIRNNILSAKFNPPS